LQFLFFLFYDGVSFFYSANNDIADGCLQQKPDFLEMAEAMNSEFTIFL